MTVLINKFYVVLCYRRMAFIFSTLYTEYAKCTKCFPSIKKLSIGINFVAAMDN